MIEDIGNEQLIAEGIPDEGFVTAGSINALGNYRMQKLNKQIIHIVLVLTFILSLAASKDVFAYNAIGPACTGGSTTQKVSFVHVGDMHARWDLAEDGYSRIRAFLKKVRLENPYTIFTNAGDDHEKGSVAEQYSRGEAVTEATFAMQFDVRTIGNHDFAWGVDHLLAFSRDPHSMVLSSNTNRDGRQKAVRGRRGPA